MNVGFIGKPLIPEGAPDVSTLSRGEPSLPPAFRFGNERIEVHAVRRNWRSTRDDRGDAYVKKHWFEFETNDGRVAVVYFDRGARKATNRWWLYSVEDLPN
jgi:hypothetical protein